MPAMPANGGPVTISAYDYPPRRTWIGKYNSSEVTYGHSKTVCRNKKLPVAEQIQLLDSLWVSLQPHQAAVSPEHAQELDNRYQQFKDGQLQTKDWQTVHHGIREKLDA